MNGTDLTMFTNLDGTLERYYALGDSFLHKAFDLLTAYGNMIAANSGLYMTLGGLDFYLPKQLQNMQHHAPVEMEKRLGDYVWNHLSHISLVPFYSQTYLDPENNVQAANKQRVDFPIHAAELLNWFETNDIYRKNAAKICEATKTYYDFPRGARGGVYPWADVTSGKRLGKITHIPFIGAMALGMAIVTNATSDIQFLEWADQKLDFAWNQRPSLLPILVDRLTQEGYYHLNHDPVESSDTDTLYHVRYLFEMWKLLDGKPAYQHYADKYRNQALAVVNQWYLTGWRPEFGHFMRKLQFADGSPDKMTIYGDGKWNTLYVLVWAYRATGEIKYLSRLKEAWENLLTMSTNTPGLVDARFDSGVGNGVLEAGHQTQFLNVLLDAYDASDDPYFIAHAVALADGMLVKGDVVFPPSNGLLPSLGPGS